MTDRDSAKHQAKLPAPLEVLERIHSLLTTAPEFTLQDGSTARIAAFVLPLVDDQGGPVLLSTFALPTDRTWNSWCTRAPGRNFMARRAPHRQPESANAC